MHYGVSIFMYLLSSYFLLEALKFPKDSAIFPIGAAIILIFLNTLYLVATIKQKNKLKQSEQADENSEQSHLNPHMSKGFIIVTSLCLVYTVLLNTIGFLFLTPIFLIVMMVYIGARNKKVILSLSIVFTLIIYLTFKTIFNISIPTGIFI